MTSRREGTRRLARHLRYLGSATLVATLCGARCGVQVGATACHIGNSLFSVGTLDPNNPCQSCQPQQSATSWTVVFAGTPCGDGGSWY